MEQICPDIVNGHCSIYRKCWINSPPPSLCFVIDRRSPIFSTSSVVLRRILVIIDFNLLALLSAKGNPVPSLHIFKLSTYCDRHIKDSSTRHSLILWTFCHFRQRRRRRKDCKWNSFFNSHRENRKLMHPNSLRQINDLDSICDERMLIIELWVLFKNCWLINWNCKIKTFIHSGLDIEQRKMEENQLRLVLSD